MQAHRVTITPNCIGVHLLHHNILIIEYGMYMLRDPLLEVGICRTAKEFKLIDLENAEKLAYTRYLRRRDSRERAVYTLVSFHRFALLPGIEFAPLVVEP